MGWGWGWASEPVDAALYQPILELSVRLFWDVGYLCIITLRELESRLGVGGNDLVQRSPGTQRKVLTPGAHHRHLRRCSAARIGELPATWPIYEAMEQVFESFWDQPPNLRVGVPPKIIKLEGVPFLLLGGPGGLSGNLCPTGS